MKNIFGLIPEYRKNAEGEYNCGDGCVLRLYGDADENSFTEYTEHLEQNGFSVLQRNKIKDNLFVSLKKDVQINALFTPCDRKIRVTASDNDLMPNFEKTECDGECKTTFYAFENDQTLIDCGMCLMVQCPDYSFFVVDSGHYFQMNDNDRIHKFMRERTPKGQKIVINGWFITHAHTDHISKLIDFLKYNTDDVIIEGFYQNILPVDYDYSGDNHEELEFAEKLCRVLEKYPAPVYKLHSGMRFYIRNLAFDVLCNHEDIFPKRITDYNDSSTVLMMEAEGSRVFISGDAAVESDKILKARYGEWLKCEVAQVAHHGHTGLSAECYSMLSAEVAVFPVTRIMFEQELPRHEANGRVLEIADSYYITGDGTVGIELPYEKGRVFTLPDETFEDFEKIKRIWRYVYSEERKNELYEAFIAHGGDPDEILLPSSKFGWIEPKPPIDE